MPLLTVLKVVGAAGAAVLLVATWPQLLGLHRAPVFSQLTALKGLVILVALAAMLLSALLAWWLRPVRRFGIGLALVFLLVAGLNAGLLASRGLSVGAVAPGGISVGAGAGVGTSDLNVFTWNTLGGRPGARLIATFAVDHDVHVLALTETSPETAHEVARLMGDAGRQMQVFALASPTGNVAQSTALLVANSLGEYALDLSVGTTPGVQSVVARPLGGDGPTFVSTHTIPPLPTRLATWERGLEWVAARCREGEAVVAGDLNATVDHFGGLHDPGADLGACRDGALALGSAALGTWPSQAHMLLASPIDHVMATPEWQFVAFRVATELDGRGSDHRALLATLRRVR